MRRIFFLFFLCLNLGANAQFNIDSLRTEAEAGDAKAQALIGTLYLNGEGVKQDYSEAMKWLLIVAERGYVTGQDSLAVAVAQYQLGGVYYEGLGINKDYSEAVKWYRKAAEYGLADAQNNLGACYDHGYGVQQSYTEAIKWYRKAANQGYEDAKITLDKMGEDY